MKKIIFFSILAILFVNGCFSQKKNVEIVVNGVEEGKQYESVSISINKENNVNYELSIDDESYNEGTTYEKYGAHILKVVVTGKNIVNKIKEVKFTINRDFDVVNITDNEEVYYKNFFINKDDELCFPKFNAKKLFVKNPNEELKEIDVFKSFEYTDVVYDGDGSYFAAKQWDIWKLDENYEEIWKLNISNKIIGRISVTKDYLVGINEKGIFSCSKDGELLWEFELRNIGSSFVSVSKMGNIFVGTKDGKVVSVSSNGELRWIFNTEGSILATIVIDEEENIYFGNKIGEVFCINNTGDIKWETKVNEDIFVQPIIDNENNIFYLSDYGNVYKFNKEGNLIWKYKNIQDIKYSSSTISGMYMSKEKEIYFFVNGDLQVINEKGIIVGLNEFSLRYQYPSQIKYLVSSKGILYIYNGNSIYSIKSKFNSILDSNWPIQNKNIYKNPVYYERQNNENKSGKIILEEVNSDITIAESEIGLSWKSEGEFVPVKYFVYMIDEFGEISLIGETKDMNYSFVPRSYNIDKIYIKGINISGEVKKSNEIDIIKNTKIEWKYQSKEKLRNNLLVTENNLIFLSDNLYKS